MWMFDDDYYQDIKDEMIQETIRRRREFNRSCNPHIYEHPDFYDKGEYDDEI